MDKKFLKKLMHLSDIALKKAWQTSHDCLYTGCTENAIDSYKS
jgi:hypothetical protein